MGTRYLSGGDAIGVVERSASPPLVADHKRNIPSLDGLRAFSVLLVILAHSAWYLPPFISNCFVFRVAVGNGVHGVAVFFVISGYLITTLLLREKIRTGTVSLRNFYLRRSWRIFPPYYVFLLVMAAAWALHRIPEDPLSFLAAATYTWAYYPGAHGYFITHTWSLSIEEQFYLLWPLAFLLTSFSKSLTRISLLLIAVMPVARVVMYVCFPSLRGHEGYMVQGWIDTMMIGCLLAIGQHQGRWEQWRRYVNGWTASAATLTFLFLPAVGHILPRKLEAMSALLINPTITASCIGIVMIYVIQNSSSPIGQLLNLKWVRHMGAISYSIYLWQQVFLSHQLALLPYGYVFLFATAEISYWFIEKPSLQWRDGFTKRRRTIPLQIEIPVVVEQN